MLQARQLTFFQSLRVILLLLNSEVGQLPEQKSFRLLLHDHFYLIQIQVAHTSQDEIRDDYVDPRIQRKIMNTHRMSFVGEDSPDSPFLKFVFISSI